MELRAQYSIFLPATKDSIHLLCIITIITIIIIITIVIIITIITIIIIINNISISICQWEPFVNLLAGGENQT